MKGMLNKHPLCITEEIMGHNEHSHKAEQEKEKLVCAVITVSDTRTPENDTSGKAIMEALKAGEHPVIAYHIVKDEPDEIIALIDDLTDSCQMILLNGGTGITRRDTTFEAVHGLLEKEITGFGELFRSLSYAEIGSAAMLSRATGGLYHDTILFSMPGSTAAVELAMSKLIMPELHHIAWMLWGK